MQLFNLLSYHSLGILVLHKEALPEGQTLAPYDPFVYYSERKGTTIAYPFHVLT